MASYDFIEQSGLGAGFVFKNNYTASYYADPDFIEITDPDYPEETVRGLVYLDGFYFVMTPSGSIYNSGINNPTTWSSLEVIQALAEPDGGVCLSRIQNLLVAFGTYSTEFFYNAANPVGSPLLPYSNSFLEVGCASAGSVCAVDNDLVFMSVSRQRGRGIHQLSGTTPKKISTPFVDRILDADDLATVNSYYIKIAGHSFYILSLISSQITLVYDFMSGRWFQWTQESVSTDELPMTSATWDNYVLRFALEDHTQLLDGQMANVLVNVENYHTMVSKKADNTFECPFPNNPGTFVSGEVSLVSTEVGFNLSGYTNTGSFDMVQDSTTGTIFAISNDTNLDGDKPISFRIRSPLLDGGDNKMKFFTQLELIGDTVDGQAYLRYSDDDYQTWSVARIINLNQARKQLNRLGRGRRRAFEITSLSDAPVRLTDIEVQIRKGIS
jgi:hypothetical protein